jgi:hypothetical protein
MASNEGGTPGGATLLPVPVREQSTFLCDSINVRRLVSHHSPMIGAGIIPADIVTPDDVNIGFVLRLGHPPGAQDGCSEYGYAGIFTHGTSVSV